MLILILRVNRAYNIEHSALLILETLLLKLFCWPDYTAEAVQVIQWNAFHQKVFARALIPDEDF